MTKLLAHFLALAVSCVLVSGSALAADPDKKRFRKEAISFAANNSHFVIYHELGHMLFSELDVAIHGREEDAADNFASWLLLTENPKSREILSDAARGWAYLGKAYGSYIHDSDYAARYSLDRQRAYQIVCLLIGYRRTTYSGLASDFPIEPQRQKTCREDYLSVSRSMRTMLEGTPPDKSKAIKVQYDPPMHGLGRVAKALRTSGILEKVAADVPKMLPVTKGLKITAMTCGEPNAFYDEETLEVIYCYELFDEFIELYHGYR
jgi:hypothetical protein